jgi:phosphatidylserine/phosphatidylglycerophosphate/cardiolipin synthase-like enzyme
MVLMPSHNIWGCKKSWCINRIWIFIQYYNQPDDVKIPPMLSGLRRIMMRITKILSIGLVVLFVLATATNTLATDLTLKNTPVQVYFSPDGGCTDAIVREIGKAKHEILVQAYSFTSKDIAKALVGAHRRGVKTEIILDKSNKSAKYSAGDFTSHMGIPTYIDSAHAIAHNKIIIIDKETVITGSFNFTKAAEQYNAENLLILKHKGLSKQYIENWNRHKGHSEVYEGK